jgi:hypothetical protein
MTFPELRSAIDHRLAAEPRLEGSECELSGEVCTWTMGRESVVISSSGSTGIHVEYRSHGRLVRTKIFAASPLSVDRIVITSAEHLTGYVFHRASAVQ